MYIIDKPNNSIKKIEEKTFHELGFKERSNLQEWIAKDPEWDFLFSVSKRRHINIRMRFFWRWTRSFQLKRLQSI